MRVSPSLMVLRPAGERKARRGWGLLQMIGGLFAGSLVLGVCVPLFITAQRHADLGAARSRITLQAREVSSHFREDVRQAATVQIAGDGRLLRLVHFRPDQPNVRALVTYEVTPRGLLREVRLGRNGAATERNLYATDLTSCRFGQAGKGVTARLDFAHDEYGRTLRYHLDCEATPRSSL